MDFNKFLGEYGWRAYRLGVLVYGRLRALLEGMRVYSDGEYIYIDAGFARIRARREYAPEALLEITDMPWKYYRDVDVKGSIVFDIGAFLGETSIWFIRRGADLVLAFEPLQDFYEMLVDNVRLNRVEDRVIPFNTGLWIHDGELKINVEGGGSGLNPWSGERTTSVKVVSFDTMFSLAYERIGERVASDLVGKFDCEGCEYTLLTLPCSKITVFREIVAEIHGAYQPLVSHLDSCGYRAEPLAIIRRLPVPLSVWRFRLKG